MFYNDFIGNEQQLFKELNVESDFSYYYNHNSIEPVELGVGYSDNKISKIYYTEKEPRCIKCMEKVNNNIKYRIYKPSYILASEYDDFLGIKNHYILSSNFNINKLVFKRYDEGVDGFNSLHIKMFNKIGVNRNKIIKILDAFNCNINGIDEWIEDNKDGNITWLAITKNIEFNITIYYRIN